MILLQICAQTNESQMSARAQRTEINECWGAHSGKYGNNMSDPLIYMRTSIIYYLLSHFVDAL